MSKKKDNKSKKFTGQVSKTRAIKILKAIGIKTAGNWNDAKLTKKIRNLPDLAEGTKLEPKMQKRVNTICNWLKDGKKVVVIDLDDVAAGKKRAEDVETAVKESKEKKTKTTKKKKRIDYICDVIKKIPKKGTSLEDIAKKANQECVKDNGNDNEGQTHHHLQVVLPVLVSFELVTEKENKLYLCE